MTAPTVCAVMLTRDRPELAAKAVECFRRQTYKRRTLLIWDTGELNQDFDSDGAAGRDPIGEIVHIPAEAYEDPPKTIGALRNLANAFWTEYDILIHWDDDDWSHPNRITEQVALLQASGTDVVGYSEMLFWRKHSPSYRAQMVASGAADEVGEAWLFQCSKQLTPAIGTSLCYWRKTWERTKFADLPRAPGGMSEYRDFLRNNKVEPLSSLGPCLPAPFYEPRMNARIHGANFMPYNIEEQIERGANAMPNEGWARVPEWDARVREILS